MKRLFAVLALVLASFGMSAQTLSISGTVADNTNAPLEGVVVFVKGTTVNTMTDADGSYQIKANSGQTLVFSLIGFVDQEVEVSNKAVINVILAEDEAFKLDESVVVGYGSQSKRTITQAIAKVKGDELINIPINSATDALKGKVAGARIYTEDFTPGAEPTILIRGGSTSGSNNSPLILIDGIERDLSGVNASDIESIEVLKDAASSAIYGSRASNGVVLVTTRKGSKAKAPRITFDAQVAHESLEDMIDYIGSEDWLNLVRRRVAVSNYANQLYLDDYGYSAYNEPDSRFATRYLQPGEAVPQGYLTMADPLDPSKTLLYQDNSWVDKCFAPALWQNYYVSVDGGTENSTYMASVGYTKDSGVAVGTDFSRLSARTNLTTKIAKNLTFTANMDFNQTLTDLYQDQYRVITRGMMTPTTQKYYYDAGPEAGLPTRGQNASSPTPLFYSYYNDNSQTNNKFGLNGTLEWNIIDDLKAVVTASMYNSELTAESFHRADTFDGTRPASASLTNNERRKAEAYLNYTHDFGKHSLSAMAGYSYQKLSYFYLAAATSGATSDKISTVNAGPTRTTATSTRNYDVNIGYFGRLNYDYAKKYLLTMTFRYDGSSRFLEGHQWGFFPGASAGWVLTEEPWFNVKSLNNLKLRVSYGQTGNNYVGYYDALGQYAIGTNYDGNASIITSAMPNGSLTWESTTQLDAGFDFGMFNNRLTGTFDYFNKLTDGMITSKTLPDTSGYGSVKTNLGSVRFKGFDIELNSRNIVRKNFTWETKFVYSYVKNVVEKLPDNGRDKNRIGGYTVTMADGSKIEFGGQAEGEPLGRFYGYHTDHIITTQQEARSACYDNSSKGWDWTTMNAEFGGKNNPGMKAIGDYEWKDLNGDHVINGQDMYLIGNTIPHSTGGLGNTFTYKNWSLNVYMDFTLGHSLDNTMMQRGMCNFFGGNTSLPVMVRECWDPDPVKSIGEPDIAKAKYARWGGNDSDNLNKNWRPTTNVFTTKADYLCLRDVSLSYNWKSAALQRAHIQNIVFTLAGNNLHYFTAVVGVNPEKGSSNTYASGYATYPPIKRISFGVKVTF